MTTSGDRMDLGHSLGWARSLRKLFRGFCADPLEEVSERSIKRRSRSGVPKVVATTPQIPPPQLQNDATTSSTSSCTTLDHQLHDDTIKTGKLTNGSSKNITTGEENISITTDESIEEEVESMPIATGVDNNSWEKMRRILEMFFCTTVAVLLTCLIIQHLDQNNFGLKFQQRTPLSFSQLVVEKELLPNMLSFVNLKQLVKDTVEQVDSSIKIAKDVSPLGLDEENSVNDNPNPNEAWIVHLEVPTESASLQEL